MPSPKFDKSHCVNNIDLEYELIVQNLFYSALHKFGHLDLKGIDGSVSVPRHAGIYLIYRNGALVYAGKAVNLRSRLTTHVAKLARATEIDTDQIAFKFADYPHRIAVAVEDVIIKRLAPPWNSQGFGSNQAGKGRQDQRVSVWEATYNISKLEKRVLTQVENLEDI